VNNLSMSVNSSLEWRRSKVQELSSQGYNQSEISRMLQISQPTINRDITYLRQQAKDNIKKYIDEGLPEEYEKCMVFTIFRFSFLALIFSRFGLPDPWGVNSAVSCSDDVSKK
jgi:hypothetical protein